MLRLLAVVGLLVNTSAAPATEVRDAGVHDKPPRIRKQPRPEYPFEAVRRNVEGTVVVEVVVSPAGDVTDVRLIESAPMLDAAAVANARQWKYVPAERNGQPVEAIARGEVSFYLGDGPDIKTHGPGFIPRGHVSRKVPQLLERLRSDQRDDRADAAWQLSGLKQPEPVVVAALVDALDDRERVVRHRAALALFLTTEATSLQQATDPEYRATHRLFPRCPRKAEQQKLDGAVDLEVLVSELGRVIHARPTSSKSLFDDAAVLAVTHWLYPPCRKGDKSVPCVTRATIQFRCSDSTGGP